MWFDVDDADAVAVAVAVDLDGGLANSGSRDETERGGRVDEDQTDIEEIGLIRERKTRR